MLQSGQPYSIIDFSGAVGSIYYSTADGITNPIVPLANGCTAKSALTGHPAHGRLRRPACPECRLLHAAAASGRRTRRRHPQLRSVRNRIHHRPAQHLPPGLPEARRRLAPEGAAFNERYSLKYTFDVYNLTNTTSFDVPGNEVSQNAGYNAFPAAPAAGASILPTDCGTSKAANGASNLYSCPAGLGIVTHTIGSPRQIQMSLKLDF